MPGAGVETRTTSEPAPGREKSPVSTIQHCPESYVMCIQRLSTGAGNTMMSFRAKRSIVQKILSQYALILLTQTTWHNSNSLPSQWYQTRFPAECNEAKLPPKPTLPNAFFASPSTQFP